MKYSNPILRGSYSPGGRGKGIAKSEREKEQEGGWLGGRESCYCGEGEPEHRRTP